MAHSIVMPALEMAQETGKLIAWRKKEGDAIVKGEPLLDVETDKAVVEIESPADGILAGVKAREGDVVPVGQTIAWIVAPGETLPTESESSATATGRRMGAKPSSPSSASSASSPSSASLTSSDSSFLSARISPKARRLAREHNIDLAHVHGTGSEGEIRAEDVMALVNASGKSANATSASSAAAQADAQTKPSSTSSNSSPSSPSSALPGALETMSSIARLMAERTTQSWTSVPHFFIVREVDATALLAVREKLAAEAITTETNPKQANTERPNKAQANQAQVDQTRAGYAPAVHVTHTDVLVALAARALRKHPRVNATWTGEAVHLNPEINIAIAMAVDDGVVTPVIPGANTKTLTEIAALRSALTERARANKLRPADISAATFTISNLGMYNVDAFTAIIVQPQAAILAVGRITDRVVPVDGKPAIRPFLTLTLSSDHRVIDGARAAAFMDTLSSTIASFSGILL